VEEEERKTEMGGGEGSTWRLAQGKNQGVKDGGERTECLHIVVSCFFESFNSLLY